MTELPMRKVVKYDDLKWLYTHLDNTDEVQEVSNYLKENSLIITFEDCGDARSGWRGEHVYLEGRDLSVNGYCFSGVNLLNHVRLYRNYKSIAGSDEYKLFINLRNKYKKIYDYLNK